MRQALALDLQLNWKRKTLAFKIVGTIEVKLRMDHFRKVELKVFRSLAPCQGGDQVISYRCL